MAAPKGQFYREFGSKLLQARRAANVTQEALGQAVGLSRTSIVNIEKGRQPVLVHVVARMARSLSTEVVDLLPESSPAAEFEMASELQKVSTINRPWVERVIAGSAYQKESEDGTEIFSRPTKSKGITSRRKSPSGSRPS